MDATAEADLAEADWSWSLTSVALGATAEAELAEAEWCWSLTSVALAATAEAELAEATGTTPEPKLAADMITSVNC